MKKRLITIISFLMAVLLGFSAMTGCKLITTDTEKDMAQVVATVSIEDGAPVDEIKKQEMIIAYLNYGYYYVYSNGWTNEQVFNMIITSLIQNRILIQNAMKDIDAGTVPFDTLYKDNANTNKWDIERYLTNFDGISSETNLISDMNEAKYQTIKSMNDMVDGYVETEEDNKVGDTLVETVRTTPTNATNEEEETTEQEKLDVISEGVKKGALGTKELKAYNKALKMLEVNGLLGDGFDGETIESTEYYKNLLKTSQENVLLNKYQNAISVSYRSAITYEMLSEKYAEMYEKQVENYTLSESDFKTALDGATADNPIIYTPYSGYGYVYNLLIGADSIQQTMISKLEGTTLEKQTARRDILESTIIKDLCSTWILSGYDFDYATKKFTGDYAFLEDSLEFKGDVTELNPNREEDEDAEYRIDEVYQYNVSEFIDLINTYIYGETKGAIVNDATKPWLYYQYDGESATKPENYDDKINELLFAFSTDSGSLNTYKGYLISPKPDGTDNETYMQEFADAGRSLITLGGSSYVIAATDYGYHIMFYSEVASANTSYATLTEYLASLGISNPEQALSEMVNGWDDYEGTDSYLYKLMNVYSSSYVNDMITLETQKIVDKYNNSDNVKKYTNRYQDLLK